MLKVVIDTNVLIDADSDDLSYANKIVDEVLAGRVEAYANRGTLRENALIAERDLIEPEYREKLQQYFEVVLPIEPILLDVEIEDREDRKILASAVAAQADYLITSDKHLLKLEFFEGVQIVQPAVFWNRYRQEELGENDWKKFISDFFKN